MSRHRAWSNSGRYPAYLELKLDLTRDTGPFSLSDRPSAWFIIASAQWNGRSPGYANDADPEKGQHRSRRKMRLESGLGSGSKPAQGIRGQIPLDKVEALHRTILISQLEPILYGRLLTLRQEQRIERS